LRNDLELPRLRSHFYRLSSDELLATVDVKGGASKCAVAHDLNRQSSDVGWSDDAPDGQRSAQLLAPRINLIA
jgi:hypothetical protein